MSQLAAALTGDAVGGMSPVVVVLGVDAVVGIAGAVLGIWWKKIGAGAMLAAGVGAVVALFGATLLEIGVAAFLLLGAAATLRAGSVRQ